MLKRKKEQNFSRISWKSIRCACGWNVLPFQVDAESRQIALETLAKYRHSIQLFLNNADFVVTTIFCQDEQKDRNSFFKKFLVERVKTTKSDFDILKMFSCVEGHSYPHVRVYPDFMLRDINTRFQQTLSGTVLLEEIMQQSGGKSENVLSCRIASGPTLVQETNTLEENALLDSPFQKSTNQNVFIKSILFPCFGNPLLVGKFISFQDGKLKLDFKSSKQLFTAIKLTHLSLAALLLESGIPTDYYFQGECPLVEATCQGSLECVLAVIKSRPAWEFRKTDHLALREAVRREFVEICWVLICNGANTNIRNRDGEFALLLAAYNGNEAILKILLKAGADINQQSNSGDTALHLASEKGHMNIVQILLTANANPNIVCKRTSQEYSPLQLAITNDQNVIAEYLIKAGAILEPDECGNRPIPQCLLSVAREMNDYQQGKNGHRERTNETLSLQNAHFFVSQQLEKEKTKNVFLTEKLERTQLLLDQANEKVAQLQEKLHDMGCCLLRAKSTLGIAPISSFKTSGSFVACHSSTSKVPRDSLQNLSQLESEKSSCTKFVRPFPNVKRSKRAKTRVPKSST